MFRAAPACGVPIDFQSLRRLVERDHQEASALHSTSCLRPLLYRKPGHNNGFLGRATPVGRALLIAAGPGDSLKGNIEG